MSNSQRELTEQEYDATFSPPMVNVSDTAADFPPLWDYLDPVIDKLYRDCEGWEWGVSSVYESRDGRFQHWYVPVPQDQTYLLAVIDKPKAEILGYYIIDLRHLTQGAPQATCCGTRGHVDRVIACRHVRNGGRVRLYTVPADDACPLQAWCGRCEAARMKDEGWYEHADKMADWAYICGGCFGVIARRAKSHCELPAIDTPETVDGA